MSYTFLWWMNSLNETGFTIPLRPRQYSYIATLCSGLKLSSDFPYLVFCFVRFLLLFGKNYLLSFFHDIYALGAWRGHYTCEGLSGDGYQILHEKSTANQKLNLPLPDPSFENKLSSFACLYQYPSQQVYLVSSPVLYGDPPYAHLP